MGGATQNLVLSSPQDTSEVAQKLAGQLEPGDVILLSGPVGAGKSHFSRHLIQSILVMPEDIPSPTFTLVQMYETTRGALWHSDLYRIASSYEVEELGLLDAFEDAICLVEWPDRLGELAPDSALSLDLSFGRHETERTLRASWQDAKWATKTKGWAKP